MDGARSACYGHMEAGVSAFKTQRGVVVVPCVAGTLLLLALAARLALWFSASRLPAMNSVGTSPP